MVMVAFTCDQQVEEEWNQTTLDLQTAREQVGDLSLKVTVLTTGKRQLKSFLGQHIKPFHSSLPQNCCGREPNQAGEAVHHREGWGGGAHLGLVTNHDDVSVA